MHLICTSCFAENAGLYWAFSFKPTQLDVSIPTCWWPFCLFFHIYLFELFSCLDLFIFSLWWWVDFSFLFLVVTLLLTHLFWGGFLHYFLISYGCVAKSLPLTFFFLIFSITILLAFIAWFIYLGGGGGCCNERYKSCAHDAHVATMLFRLLVEYSTVKWKRPARSHLIHSD